MNRNDDEKLTDILMGEAFLALLHAGGPLSAGRLIAKLRAIAMLEKSETRKQACERAIAEVRSSLSYQRDQSRPEVRSLDNNRFLLGNDYPTDDTRIH